ncbi:MAG TPA: hypothetical protein VE225_09855 [Rubrobacteraceae bacterium]|nr:hypothetical protein [Rubrobacteraceae bacterium]
MKKTIVLKLLKDQRVRRLALNALKNPTVRRVILKQIIRQLRRR